MVGICRSLNNYKLRPANYSTSGTTQSNMSILLICFVKTIVFVLVLFLKMNKWMAHSMLLHGYCN